jgi:hypothetical protein
MLKDIGRGWTGEILAIPVGDQSTQHMPRNGWGELQVPTQTGGVCTYNSSQHISFLFVRPPTPLLAHQIPTRRKRAAPTRTRTFHSRAPLPAPRDVWCHALFLLRVCWLKQSSAGEPTVETCPLSWRIQTSRYHNGQRKSLFCPPLAGEARPEPLGLVSAVKLA